MSEFAFDDGRSGLRGRRWVRAEALQIRVRRWSEKRAGRLRFELLNGTGMECAASSIVLREK
jgi:hypothetical protein